MKCYKKMYYHLFNKMSDIVMEIETSQQDKNSLLNKIENIVDGIKLSQQKTEDLYIKHHSKKNKHK